MSLPYFVEYSVDQQLLPDGNIQIDTCEDVGQGKRVDADGFLKCNDCGFFKGTNGSYKYKPSPITAHERKGD